MQPIVAAEPPRRREGDSSAFGRAALHCFSLIANLDLSLDTAAATGPLGERVVFVNRTSLGGSTARFDEGSSPAGDAGFLLARFDAAGAPTWTKRFDGAVRVEGIAIDGHGNTFLTGMFLGSVNLGGTTLVSVGADAFLLKLDAWGRHVWSRRFGDSYCQGRSVAISRGGGVFVTGVFFGSPDFGAGSIESRGSLSMFVARFDGAGRASWSKRFGGSGITMGLGITVRDTGRLAVSAICDGPVDFGGGPLLVRDGTAIVSVELDSSGNHLTSRRVGLLQTRLHG